MIYGKVVFPRNKNQKGAVLIFSLIVVSALLVLSGAYLSMIISENRLVSRSYNSTVAINLAEAGVERAIWELIHSGGDFLDSEGWSGTDSKTISDSLQTAEGNTIGEYAITVTYLSGSNPEIEATGFVPNQSSPKARRSVKVVLEKDRVKSSFSYYIN